MSSDELSTVSKLAVLRQRIADTKRLGVRVRSEWLGGETGGGCEIGGVRWVFIDLSLSVDEQLGQLSDALATLRIDESSER